MDSSWFKRGKGPSPGSITEFSKVIRHLAMLRQRILIGRRKEFVPTTTMGNMWRLTYTLLGILKNISKSGVCMFCMFYSDFPQLAHNYVSLLQKKFF